MGNVAGRPSLGLLSSPGGQVSAVWLGIGRPLMQPAVAQSSIGLWRPGYGKQGGGPGGGRWGDMPFYLLIAIVLMNGPLSRVPRCTCPISCSAPPRGRDVYISVPVWYAVECGRGALWDFRDLSIDPWHSIVLLVLIDMCYPNIKVVNYHVSVKWWDKKPSRLCMLYVYVIVKLKYFWHWLWTKIYLHIWRDSP